MYLAHKENEMEQGLTEHLSEQSNMRRWKELRLE